MRLSRRAFAASLLIGSWSGLARSRTADLQRRLGEIMSRRQGTALVLDAVSGAVLADHRLAAAARRLVPPGSVIKPFVMASLIDAGVVRANTLQACGGALRIAGRRLDCSHGDIGAAVDPVNALAYSCNNFFGRMAVHLRPQDLVRTLNTFGLT